MPRKPLALILLAILLLGGRLAWPMGRKMDIFVPVDALIQEKRYSEALARLQDLLVSAPARTGTIRDRIAETELLEADDEISSQRYNQALATLSTFWAEFPEKADQAQKRIRKINRVREEYNKEAKELLAYMSDAKNRVDPDYNKEITDRLEKLDGLDRDNPDSKKTITSLKETSLSLVNQDSMKAVMSAGRVLIDGGDYAKALRQYLKGFPLFRPEFENAGYDELTMEAVAGVVRKTEAMPDAYDASQASLSKSVADLAAAFQSGSPDRISAALAPARTALENFRSLRESLFATGADLARSYDALPKEGKSPIEYQYLAYLDIFLRGRPDSWGPDKKPEAEKGKPEGMGGVLLAQSAAILDSLGKAAQASVDSAYAAAGKAYDAGSYADAGVAFSRALALVAPGAEVLGYWALLPESGFVPDLAGLRAKIGAAAADQGRISQLGALASAGQRLSELAASYDSASSQISGYLSGLKETLPVADVRTALDGYRSSIQAIEAKLGKEADGRAALARAAAEAATALGDSRPNDAFGAYSARLDKALAGARAAEYLTVAARGRIEGDYVDRELAARTAAVSAADALTDSLPTTTEAKPEGLPNPASPTAAAAALTEEGPKLTVLTSWISGDLGSMASESPALLADPAFAAARAKMEDLGKKATELQARGAAALARAQAKIKAAAAALGEARKYIEAAKARLADAKTLIAQDKGKGVKSAVIRKDFTDSQDRLENGRRGIVESSNEDYDPKTWDDFQQLYSTLNSDLDRSKREWVNNEDERLLAEGQTYYSQGLFDLASESLNVAQELWREDNDTDDDRVKYWQNLVKQASDTNNKREVKPGDALYYEIGNYLSQARKLYLKGDSLMKSDRKSDADAAFVDAQHNLSYVTVTFPLNSEAGLLNLQISKSTNPDLYDKSLPVKIKEAVDLLAADPTRAYSEIADLYRMEPRYPGLKTAYENAEIAVGILLPPPTKEALAKVASLLSKAERELNTGRSDQRKMAEADLIAAYAIDPNNRQVNAHLRDIKTIESKATGPTLGLADQAILDQATRSFAASQYNQARDQLSQLLSDPGKRTRDVLKLDNDLKTLGY